MANTWLAYVLLGTVSEDLNSLPQPFAEVWHFVKPAGSTQDWLVAGIQQEA